MKASIDYICSDIGMLTLKDNWYGIKRIQFDPIQFNNVKKNEKVIVEITGGRKSPTINNIRKA